MVILHSCHCACARRSSFYFRSKIWRHYCVPLPYFLKDAKISAIRVYLLIFAWIFRTTWHKMGFGSKYGNGWYDVDLTELVFTFESFYVCSNFGENWSSNATMRVRTGRYTDAQTQTVFGRPYYRSRLWHTVSSDCLSSVCPVCLSVTFCIVANR